MDPVTVDEYLEQAVEQARGGDLEGAVVSVVSAVALVQDMAQAAAVRAGVPQEV